MKVSRFKSYHKYASYCAQNLLVQINFVKSLGVLMAQEGDILVNPQRNGEWSMAIITPYLSAMLQIGSSTYKMQPMGSEGQKGADD